MADARFVELLEREDDDAYEEAVNLVYSGQLTKMSSGPPYPLILACENGWDDVIAALLDVGVKVGVQDSSSGDTPLILAVRNDVAVDLLKKMCACLTTEEINAQDDAGFTATHYAVFVRQDPLLCALLVDAGADIYLENDMNESALQMSGDGAMRDALTFPQNYLGGAPPTKTSAGKRLKSRLASRGKALFNSAMSQ